MSRRVAQSAALAMIWWVAWWAVAQLGPGEPTSHFYFSRVAARLTIPGTLVLAVIAAGVGFQGRPLSWWLVALLGFAPYAFVPQGMPDAALYAEYALWGTDVGPWGMLRGWGERVWSAPDALRHTHLPGVPWLTARVLEWGLPWRLTLVAWALARVWATQALGGPWSATLLLAVPYLWANTGWLLVDVPTAAAVGLGLAGLVRGRLWPCLLALPMKISAGLFLVGPVLVCLLRPWQSRRRALAVVALGVVSLVVLFGVVGHRVRPLDTYGDPARSLLIHLTPWLLGGALVGLLRGGEERRRWILAASVAGLFAVVRYSPSDHVVRYALPAIPALVACASRALAGRAALTAAAFGLGLGMVAWRPLVVHHVSANVHQAMQALPEETEVVDVWVDYGSATVPPQFLVPLVALETSARVQYRGVVPESGKPAPRQGRRWWDHPLAGRFAPVATADHTLVMSRGVPALPPDPGQVRGVFDTYRASSFAYPTTVTLLFALAPSNSQR